MNKIVKCILPIMSSAALVTPVLVSCGKPIEYYQVTQEEMDDALGMKGIEYMQIETHIQITPSPTIYFQCSPTVCHQIEIDDDSYYEEYVIKSQENYSKYRRFSSGGTWVGPTVASKDDFVVPDDIASNLSTIKNHIPGSVFTFDANDKSYKFDLSLLDDYKNGSFYFENKKIVKYELLKDLNNLQSKGTPYKQIYTYKKITPTPPEIK